MKEKHPSLAPLLDMPVQKTLSQEDIKHNIPHREPFLLVDEVRVVEDGKTCVGIKHVKGDEYFFKGHFPQKPIMPGVLILERQMPVQILRLGKLSRIYAEAYVNGKLCTEAYLTFILGENLNV